MQLQSEPDPSYWERLSRVYHQARNRDEAERAAFLKEACAGDETMRRELAAMLDTGGQMRDFLEHPVFADATTNAAQKLDTGIVGREVGGYHVLSRIGVGGMGVVYKAVDPKFQRPVAVKFLSDVFADAPARSRFVREAQTASSLNHPHILTVYDIGELDGRQYMVTEFVDSGTLREWRDAEPRTWNQVVELLIGVADALATAHEAGIIHRDVKPENILISKSGYAKLADFGLAKLLGATAEETSGNALVPTHAGAILGTPGYMSPEQAAGGVVDARTDVFSFGVVVHEMLAGRRPFAATTTPEELQRIICSSPDRLGEDVPQPLRVVVEKALEKVPERRYQTMRELLGDLRQVTRAGAAARSDVWTPRRRRLMLAAMGVTLIAVIAMGAVAIWRSGRSAMAVPQISSIAVLPFQNLSGDQNQEYFSDGMTEALISNLAQIHALAVTSRTSVMRFKGTKQGMPEIGRILGVDAIVESSVQRAGNRVRIIAQLIRASTDTHLWAREFNGSTSDLLELQSDVAREIAQEIRVQITPDEKQRLATVRHVSAPAQDAFLRARQEYWKLNADGYKKATQLLQSAIELQPDYAAAYAALSLALRDLQGSVVAEDTHGEIRKAAYRAIALDPNLGEAQAALGALSSEDWDWGAAEQAFRRAVELNPDSQDTCTCYAAFLSAMGRHSDAIAMMRHAVKVNPLSSAVHANLGQRLYEARRYPEALTATDRALELEPTNDVARFVRAAVYQQIGRAEDAVREIGQSGFRDGVVAATAYAVVGRQAEAEELARKFSPKAGPFEFLSLAVTYAWLGKKDVAFEWLMKAFDARYQYVAWANASPYFDVFRGDARFDALLARLRLPG